LSVSIGAGLPYHSPRLPTPPPIAGSVSEGSPERPTCLLRRFSQVARLVADLFECRSGHGPGLFSFGGAGLEYRLTRYLVGTVGRRTHKSLAVCAYVFIRPACPCVSFHAARQLCLSTAPRLGRSLLVWSTEIEPRVRMTAASQSVRAELLPRAHHRLVPVNSPLRRREWILSKPHPHHRNHCVVKHNPHFLGPLWIAQTDHPGRLVILVKWALHHDIVHFMPSPEAGPSPAPGYPRRRRKHREVRPTASGSLPAVPCRKP